MLKRQRAISPPPSNPEIPLVSDTPESHRRESKRRRVLPPSLDGQSRRAAFPAEDDGEEDDDYDAHPSDRQNPADSASSGSTAYNTEYQSANTFLHDLHALHRHRLLFSSPPQPLLQPTLFPPPVQEKLYFPQIVDPPRMVDKQDLSGTHGFGLPAEEVENVKERYEETNRMLGSLFLTRRKQLDPGPPQYNT
ncbi:hypothetical protein C8R45DRAFT_952029 [Mycena sanguinolenta]|nr:hypothetical protein C8R45DRAFT_952029 [Mycena sanguinolenta]